MLSFLNFKMLFLLLFCWNGWTGTRRGVFDCFQRYQSRYNPHKRKFGWTPKENAQLTQVMANYRVDSVELIDWASIRNHFPGRSKTQIFSHFKYHCCVVNGKDFSRGEDELIRQSLASADFDEDKIEKMLRLKAIFFFQLCSFLKKNYVFFSIFKKILIFFFNF